MPSYTYRCNKCGHTFDEIHSINSRKDPESKPCPECGESNQVEQIITGFVGVTYGDNLQTPTWFKDRLAYMNKELGTNVSAIK